LHSWVRYLAAATVLAGCAGDSCLQPLPGGFPEDERISNGMQMRLSTTGLHAIEDNVDSVIQTLAPGGLNFDVPSVCGDPKICCNADPGTCAIEIDLHARAGDPPRLELRPDGGRLGAVLRARVRTKRSLPVKKKVLFFSISCDVNLNTEDSGPDSITARVLFEFGQDPKVGTTRLSVPYVDVRDLNSGDIDLDGGLVCEIADLFKGFFVGMIEDKIEEEASGAIENLLCKRCETSDQCAPYGSCSDGVCQINDGAGSRCQQEIGMVGRLQAAALLEVLPENTWFDMYLVAGGGARAPRAGLSLGFVTGARASASDPDKLCGPSFPPPNLPMVQDMSLIDRNDLEGQPFDFGLGLHTSFLDRVGWAIYESGVLCATVDRSTFELLSSESLSLVTPSIIDVLHGNVGEVMVRFRPQAPPRVSVGHDPLLKLLVPDFEMDFYVSIDYRLVRMFTARFDLTIPVDLEVDGGGGIVPVIGKLDRAFANVSIETTGLLAETPAQLATSFPALGTLTVPYLTNAIGPIDLPSLAGMSIRVSPGGFRAVDDEFLGVFGTLAMAQATQMAGPGAFVDTRVQAGPVVLPAANMLSAAAGTRPKLGEAGQLGNAGPEAPSVELDLSGVGYDGSDADLEWQVRLNGGPWSPYSRERRRMLSSPQLWLAGHHRIEVRARHVGAPETVDPAPELLVVTVDPRPPRVSLRWQGDRVRVEARDDVTAAEELKIRYRLAGGDWLAAKSSRGPLLISLDDHDPGDLELEIDDGNGNVVLASGAELPYHKRARGIGCAVSSERAPLGGLLVVLLGFAVIVRRPGGRLLLVAVLGVGAGASGCGGGSGSDEPAVDRVEQRTVVGRFSDVAESRGRVMVASYEEVYGDLVVGDVSESGEVVNMRVVDGAPDGPVVGDPMGYRGGVEQRGPNVGAWSTICIVNDRAYIAYKDLDAKSLKFARESGDGWITEVVDRVDGADVGAFAALDVSFDDVAGIAYVVSGIPDGDEFLYELRWAEAQVAGTGALSWTIEVLDRVRVPEPASDDLNNVPRGVGLFASMRWFLDGRPVITYYHREAGELRMALRGSGGWRITTLDGGGGADVGRWTSVLGAFDGTVHVAYQDAGRGELRYVSYVDGLIGPVEVVDDGRREDGRRHPVGASAGLVIDRAGQLTIVYQDSFTAHTVAARRSEAGDWVPESVFTGEVGSGFFVSVDRADRSIWVSSYSYDHTFLPPGRLQVTSIP
jgi:hypothetical protein